MVNRSLRRNYDSTTESANNDSGANGSEQGSESERFSGIAEPDSDVNGNGEVEQRNTDSASSGVDVINVENIDEYIAGNSERNSDGNGDGTRKRRKRGPNKRTAGKAKAQASVEPFLLMAHQWASVLLKTPEIMIDATEAKSLSDAYEVFCEHHEVPILSPKRMSEINMIAALALVYGPRFVAVRNRRKEEKKVKQARNVTPIQGVM